MAQKSIPRTATVSFCPHASVVAAGSPAGSAKKGAAGSTSLEVCRLLLRRRSLHNMPDMCAGHLSSPSDADVRQVFSASLSCHPTQHRSTHITDTAGCQLPNAHCLLILPTHICSPFSCDVQLYRLDFASKGTDLPRLGKPLASEAAHGRLHRLSWSTLGHGTADQQVSLHG